MRLLYLCNDFGIPLDGTKGASVRVRAITRALAALGHDLFLYSPRGRALNGHPAQVVTPTGKRPSGRIVKKTKHWLEAHQLSSSLGSELRSLFHSVMDRDSLLEMAREVAPDAIVERLSLFGMLGVELADALDVPLILEVNAPLAEEARWHRNLNMQQLAAEIEHQVMSRADAVLCVSRELANTLAAAGIERNKVKVIPNGVDASWLNGASETTHGDLGFDLAGRLVIGFAGSFKPWHGVDLLMRAFKRVCEDRPNLCLLLVGGGPEEQALRLLADSLDLRDSVVFTGPVDHEHMPWWLSMMDVAVAPFRPVENFYFSPIKLFEYMGAGKCIVASRLGQMAEIVTHGIDGLLFEPENVADLTETLSAAVRDEALRQRVGAHAREHVAQAYTWEHAARETCRVIEDVRRRCDGDLLSHPEVSTPRTGVAM